MTEAPVLIRARRLGEGDRQRTPGPHRGTEHFGAVERLGRQKLRSARGTGGGRRDEERAVPERGRGGEKAEGSLEREAEAKRALEMARREGGEGEVRAYMAFGNGRARVCTCREVKEGVGKWRRVEEGARTEGEREGWRRRRGKTFCSGFSRFASTELNDSEWGISREGTRPIRAGASVFFFSFLFFLVKWSSVC